MGKMAREINQVIIFLFKFEICVWSKQKKGIEMFQLFEELLRTVQSPYKTIFKNILLIFI